MESPDRIIFSIQKKIDSFYCKKKWVFLFKIQMLPRLSLTDLILISLKGGSLLFFAI